MLYDNNVQEAAILIRTSAAFENVTEYGSQTNYTNVSQEVYILNYNSLRILSVVGRLVRMLWLKKHFLVLLID